MVGPESVHDNECLSHDRSLTAVIIMNDKIHHISVDEIGGLKDHQRNLHVPLNINFVRPCGLIFIIYLRNCSNVVR